MNPSLTLRGLLLAAVALLATACATPPSGDDPGYKGFSLWSPGRVDNALLDTKYGGKNPANANCPGENISPALSRRMSSTLTTRVLIRAFVSKFRPHQFHPCYLPQARW